MNEKKLYSIGELPAVNGGPLPMSIGGLYKAISDGKIPHTKIGKRIFVPAYFIEQMFDAGK